MVVVSVVVVVVSVVLVVVSVVIIKSDVVVAGDRFFIASGVRGIVILFFFQMNKKRIIKKD